MNPDEWLDKIAPGASNTLLASAIGKHPSAVTRWRNGSNPITMEDVLALARHFNASVLTSFRDLGFLQAHETRGIVDSVSFQGVTNEMMLEEMMKRAMSARFRLGMLEQQVRGVSQATHSEDAQILADAVRGTIHTYKRDVIGRGPDEPPEALP